MRDDIVGLGSMRMFPQVNMTPQTVQTQRSLPLTPSATSPAAANFASQLAQASQRAALNARNAQILTSNAQRITNNAQVLTSSAQRITNSAQVLTSNAQRTANNAQVLANSAQRTTNNAQALANNARLAQSTAPYSSPLKANPNQPKSASSLNHMWGRPTSPKTPAPPSTSAPKPPVAPKPPTPTKPAAPIQKPEPPRPPTAPNPNAPMPLNAYPHPNGDNGRGMHWIPTTSQSPDAVDRFVGEAKRMGVKWITFLNDGAKVGDNDYLVKKLVEAGIEPVMRVWTPTIQPIEGDLEGMVRHYASMGVHYFQPYNEPNLNDEQPDGKVSVDRYLDNWIPAAQAIIRGGGLPGFGSMAPGGDMDDQEFLSQAVAGLKQRGQLGLLDKGWLSMHNYTHNHPIEEPYTDGFFKFRNYRKIMSDALGRDLPIIGTEGGTFVGEQEDTSMPAADADTVARWAAQGYSYMRDKREPWNFAYSFWTIANDAGGGSDPRFNAEALFKGDGSVSQVVNTLRAMG
jgi:hypothetical protein